MQKVGDQCHTDVLIPSCLDERLFLSSVRVFQAASLLAQECHLADGPGLLLSCPSPVRFKLLFSLLRLTGAFLGRYMLKTHGQQRPLGFQTKAHQQH